MTDFAGLKAMQKFHSTLQMTAPDLKLVPYEGMSDEVLIMPRVVMRREEPFMAMPYKLKDDTPNLHVLEVQVERAMAMYAHTLQKIIVNPRLPELSIRETRSQMNDGTFMVNVYITTDISENEYIQAAERSAMVSYIAIVIEGGSMPYDDNSIRNIFRKTIGHMVTYRWAEPHVFRWTTHDRPAFSRTVK